MVFRRNENDDEHDEEDEDGLNIVSADDEGDEGEALFQEGDTCWACQQQPGRVGLDPTCHGAYDGEPLLLCYGCLDAKLAEAYAANDGVAAIVEPFGKHDAHLYYRLDEMPAYGFPREDIEPVSWLFLMIGDTCARCPEQSRYAWLTRDFVDPALPEDADTPVFRHLERDCEHLCRDCAAKALAKAYRALDLPLLVVEVPRSAMGVLMPAEA